MLIPKKKIVWFVFSLIISSYVGVFAYQQPVRFFPLIDLLATIVSILIGVSLAISAVLSTSFSIGASNYANEEEKKRIEKILKSDDESLIEGQHIVFWFYYCTLILALLFKLVATNSTINPAELYIMLCTKVISGIFGFVSCLALLWSATLPTLLRSISIQRKNLDK